MLYKYKSVTKDNIQYTIDIIENQRIFVSDYDFFNDPLEGYYYHVTLGVMGAGLYAAAGEFHRYYKEALKEYKVLCSTPKCQNAQMWAHYADQFQGICIGFKTNKAFAEAENVRYVSKRYYREIREPSPKVMKRIAKNALLYKESGWKYESEWRLILHQEGMYLPFGRREIKHIIVGHKMDGEYARQIKFCADKYRIPVYKTYINETDYSIKVVNFNHNHDDYTGEKPKYIKI